MVKSSKESPKKVFKSLRKVARFFDRCTLLILAFCLPLLLLMNGGLDYATHSLMVPAFSLLLFFHGLTVFLKSKASIKAYKLSTIPLLFVPFLIWLIVSANFISATPWKGHINLIYYFEAFIVLWIASNHLKSFRRLQTICIALLLTGSYSLFLGYSQFFHARNASLEIDYVNNITGLFFDSSAFAFLICVSLGALIPAVFLRFLLISKRFILLVMSLLLFFGLIMAQDIQGYTLITLVVLISSFFSFRKRKQFISFNGSVLVLALVMFGSLFLFMPAFSKHFAVPYYFEGQFYFLEVFYTSIILCFKNLIWGTGLGSFPSGILAVQSQSLPLLLDNPNNSLFMILSETGLIGLLLLLIPIYYILKRSFSGLKESPKWELIDGHRWVPMSRFVVLVSSSFLLSYLACSLFISVTLFPFFLCLGALVLGTLSMSRGPSLIKLQLKKNIERWSYLLVAASLGLTFAYDATSSIKSESYLTIANEFYSQSFQFDQSDQSDQSDARMDALYQSIAYVELAIKENPKNYDALILKNELLNAFYSKNEIYYEHLMEMLLGTSQKVMDSAGNYWKAYLRYGASLAIEGKEEEAEQALKKAVEIAPQSLEANLYMAAFLFHFEGRHEESKSYLEKALEIDPYNAQALAINRKLNI